MKEIDALSLDGRQLRLFLAVYDTTSVTKAADVLSMSQSAVSHGLDRLRSILNDPLFVKMGRGIAPTETATVLAPRVRTILADIEGLAIQREYSPASDPFPLTIAANITELLPILIEISRGIRFEAPHAHVRMIDMGAPAGGTRMLDQNTADMVLTMRPTPLPPQIQSEALYHTRHLCYFDGSQRQPPNTLQSYIAAQHGVLDFGTDGLSILDRALRPMGVNRDIVMAAGNSQVLASLIKGTPIIATLPEPLARTSFKGFDTVLPPFDLEGVTCRMLWHRRANKSGRHTWLTDIVRSAALRI